MQIELRHWRAFVTAAETEHFGVAAERLGISQPALSQLIRTLEATLGTDLFDRSGRRVRISGAGRDLLSGARATILQADLAERTGAAIGRRTRRAVAAGYVGSSAFHPLFARLIRAIGAARPVLPLRLDQCSATTQVRHLVEERIDVGLVRSPLPTLESGLASLCLARERLVLALPSADPRRAHGIIRLADLRDEDFVLYIEQPSGGLRSLIVGACRTAGFEPRIAQTVPQIATMLCMVGASVGLALVPETMARFEIPGVAYLPVAETVETELTLLHRRSDTAPAVRTVFRIARQLSDKPALSK